jgi:uncharacterized protein YegP (UPF0339 family)
MSHYTIFKGTDSQYYFNLRANNNEIVLSSEGYASKQGCENGITSCRVNAPYDNRYDRRTSVNLKPYFVLKASNGEIIGTSQMYSSIQSRDHGIEVVKREAPNAAVVDNT